MSPFCSLLLKRFWKMSLTVYKVIWEEDIEAQDCDWFQLFTFYDQFFFPANSEVTYEVWVSNENKGAIDKPPRQTVKLNIFCSSKLTTVLTFFTWLNSNISVWNNTKFQPKRYIWSLDSAVTTVIPLRVRQSVVRLPAWMRGSSFFRNVQTVSKTRSVSYWKGSAVFSPWD